LSFFGPSLHLERKLINSAKTREEAFFADLRGFSPEMLDGIKNSGNHHFKQKWRHGTADRKIMPETFQWQGCRSLPLNRDRSRG
jgi:hypothetical protein